MDIIKEHQERQAQAYERFTKLSAIAQAQGLVLVPVSARRCLVVKINPASSGVGLIGRDYHTHLYGSVVFGPGTYGECRTYIAENTKPVPLELIQ